MWLKEGLEKKKGLKRDGLIKSINLPKDKNLKENKYGIKISVKDKSISFTTGKKVHIITDLFGISEVSEFTLFFVEDYFVIELQKGCLYLKDSKDNIYSIDNKNNISEYDGDSNFIYWKTYIDILDYCKNITANKFNLSKEEEILSYLNNLIYSLKASFSYTEGNLFSMRFVEFFYDLGIDKFKYIKKEKQVSNKVVIPEKSKSFKEEDYLKEFESKAEIKVKKTSNTLSDEEDDTEDINILPIHMHEVDIFNDYLSDNDDCF